MPTSTSLLAGGCAVLLFILLSGTSGEVGIITLSLGTVIPIKQRISQGVSLPAPIISWYSIPYAAPPIGERRFAFPQAPIKWNQPLMKKDYGPICLQAPSPYEQDEDCLSLSVFAPAGTKADSKLPVVVWVPGGAFNVGSGRSFNLPSMISNAPAPFIGVSINYRLGALGFLPSDLTASANLLNLGLADQKKAFEFIRTHISAFGGDPETVTLFGESAGAHSVGYHLLHTDPGAERLFKRVIMDSGGPTARGFPDYTYPMYETQMSEFLDGTNCERGQDWRKTFACLRLLQASDLQDVSNRIYAKYHASMRWPFQPVIDYKYIRRAASESWAMGDFQKVNILTGFNSNEGSWFAPRNFNSTSDMRSWFKVLNPALTNAHLDEVERLYPLSDYAVAEISPQYSRMVDAYGDYAYIAQVQENAVSSVRWAVSGVNTYKYHFAQPTPGAPLGWGVSHLSELAFVSVVNLSAEDTVIGKIMNAYYTSFIVTGDPNALSKPKDEAMSYWPAYTTEFEYQMKFGGHKATVEKDDIRREATDFWRSIPKILQH